MAWFEIVGLARWPRLGHLACFGRPVRQHLEADFMDGRDEVFCAPPCVLNWIDPMIFCGCSSYLISVSFFDSLWASSRSDFARRFLDLWRRFSDFEFGVAFWSDLLVSRPRIQGRFLCYGGRFPTLISVSFSDFDFEVVFRPANRFLIEMYDFQTGLDSENDTESGVGKWCRRS